MDDHEVLPGNVSSVVRVGGTVRRSLGLNSGPVQALLQHLEAVGFDGAPRFRGIDYEGREILDFVPGSTPTALDYDLNMLRVVGATVRRLHDATESFALPDGMEWIDPPNVLGAVSVVGHNDLAPRNTVVGADGNVTFIDWDAARPCSREWDLAHALWQFSYLGPEAMRERPRAEHEARITSLLDGYGRDAFDPDTVVDCYIPVTQRTFLAIESYVRKGILSGTEPEGWMQDIREQQVWARAEDAWLRRAARA